MTWVSWALIGAFTFATLSFANMLLYRHGHKTTIEMDLLLKQMQISSRLWTGLGIYRDYFHDTDKYHDMMEARWNNTRERIKTMYGHDMGDFMPPPVLDADVACLLVDIEENTL